MARLALFLCFLPLLALISGVNCRALSSVSEDNNNSILVSDGVQDRSSNEFLSLDPPNLVSDNACVHVYGFLPCADNMKGYIFQVFSFGCLLIIGEYFLSKGRSKLFVIFEVGFFGGIIFPLLTMFPRIALILSTGLMGSREMANSMVGNNVAVTVGYSVFALTMQWGACVVFGLPALASDSPTSDEEVQITTSGTKSPRRKFIRNKLFKDLAGASVRADPKNRKAAGIMLLTLFPFVLVTFSETFHSKSWDDSIILITLIVSGSASVLFFVYLYFDKVDQVKSLDNARFELMSEVHKHLQNFAPQSLIRDKQLSKESLKSLFEKIDVNRDGKIQVSELKDLTVEFGVLGRMKCDVHELTTTLLADFDSDRDGEIDETEFEKGIEKWLKQYKFTADSAEPQREYQALQEDDRVLKMEILNECVFTKLLTKRTLKAVTEVIIGILIVSFLAMPFMMNIELLSVSAGVPSFYVVFAVIPLARNLKNALSAHFCRKKDQARITSDKFFEIYRDVTLNNLLGITIILAIVYTRGLSWDYSTEVLIIVIVGLIIGVPAYVRSTYPFWICVLAFALYFFSLVLIYLHVNSL
ncbi:sodium/calcium exchanger NCL isoform X1 [Capsella rubella]|uniref:sodium/calcium exchanger NCL isoform X1 n=1 Tax=Capsella rubella TaxID=81985 RepID=UPI000CD5186B|nr:sodium/calcium exchanger NCL isoform X1 [Capsella rubella]